MPMEDIVQQIFASQKGILALDWSTKTIAKKFAELGLTSTPELNRQYRQMLLTSQGVENHISGVILFDETANQKLDSGQTFPEYLTSHGIIPGIKVDRGAEKFNEVEELTLGIEDLGERLADYSKLGLKFAKWRSLFKITDIYPSKKFLDENLNRLVFYTKTCIENGFVPLLEPEVSMKGNHTAARCGEITELVLLILFEKLKKENIDIHRVILKTNMVLPGQDGITHTEPLEVAEATLRIFKRSLPADLQGVVFLSGGQTPDQATKNLNEIEKRNVGPWKITFSFARALQSEALNAWRGEGINIPAAQTLFTKRLEDVSLARQGKL